MYFFNFFTSLTKKNNILVLFYFILNVLIITWIISVYLSSNGTVYPSFHVCFISAIVFYTFSIIIALSPIGEWILRLMNGCKKVTRKDQIAIIEPIFHEVYAKAKLMCPDLPDDITIYVKRKSNDGEGANAFAAGRKTICVTEALLYQPNEQIKAVLAHEFGHLAHHDTGILLIITVGNLIITTIISIVIFVSTILKFIFSLISQSKSIGVIGAACFILTALFTLVINLMNRLWSQIGVWLCMKASRSNEYLADEFSLNLGYGVSLCQFLDEDAGDSKAEGLFAALASSHPDSDDRIARLQGLGCEYTKSH